MRRRYRFLLGTAGVATLLVAALAWLLATESGARWLFARAESYLPAALSIEGVSGSLTRGITADGVAWRDESVTVDAERVFVHAALLPLVRGRLDIEQLDVAATVIALATTESASTPGKDAGPMELRLPFDLSIADASFTDLRIDRGASVVDIDTLRFAGRMEASDLEIDRFVLKAESVSLSVDGRIRLAGRYRGSANAAWRWSDDREYAGRLRIRGDLDGYEIEHLLDAPVAVESHGVVSLEGAAVVADLSHTWQSLEWPIGERTLRSASGTLTTVGGIESLELALGTTLQIDGLPESRISLSGNVDASRLHIDAGTVENEFGVLDVDGDLHWTPAASLDFRVSGIDPARLSDRLAGMVAAAGHVDARLDGGAPSVSLRVDSVDGMLNDSEVCGRANVGWAGNTLTVSDAEISVGDSRLSAAASIGDSVSIDAAFEFGALDRLFADAAGSIEGTLDIDGPRAAPDVRLSAAGSELRWTHSRVDSITVDANIRAQGLTIVDVRAAGVAVGEQRFDTVEASASGSLERHRLSLFAESGTATIEIEGVGGVVAGGWRGEIATADVTSDRFGRWSAGAASALSISSAGTELGALCMVSDASAGRLCASGAFDPSGNGTVKLAIDALPIEALPLGLPDTTQIAGTIDAEFDATVLGRVVSGDASLALVDASLMSVIDDEELTVAFNHARAEASIRDNRGQVSARFELEGNGEGEVELRLDDVFDVEAPVDGRATLTLSDADLFAFLLPDLSDPYAVVEGTLLVGGSLAQPEFTGGVTLTDGRFGLRNAGIAVVDVNARIEQQSVGRLRLSGSGRSGEGSLSIEGETLLAAGSGIRSQLRVRGENFELMRLPDWQLSASPDIEVVFDNQTATVSGALEVPRAAITVRDIPQSAESASSDTVVHRKDGSEQTARRHIDIDVDVSLGDEVRFSGFGLVTGLGGDLRVRGGTDTPYTGVGRLTLDGGRYEAYGQELDIEVGNLIFNGPLDEPQLDVRAVRKAGDVSAGILLTGTPSRLRSELVSEPPMSDAEALAYLLTGRSLENATDAGQGDTLNQAAFALGLSGAGSIVSQIRGNLGLDTLSVEGGASSSRIVAGKRFGNRLFVEYGYGLIDQLGTLLLRYQLNDRLVLESRTGTTSNLDLLYSVKKK